MILEFEKNLSPPKYKVEIAPMVRCYGIVWWYKITRFTNTIMMLYGTTKCLQINYKNITGGVKQLLDLHYRFVNSEKNNHDITVLGREFEF